MSFFDFPVYEINQSIGADSVLVDGPHIYISAVAYGANEKGLLQKILGAAKFDLASLPVTIMEEGMTVKAFKRGLKSDQLVISFGLTAQQLGLNCDTQPYQIMNMGGHSILFSHALTTLSGNPDMKKALWGALKHFYNL